MLNKHKSNTFKEREIMILYGQSVCQKNIRPCLIIEALLNKMYVRKNAFSFAHPAVRNYYTLTDNMHECELDILNSIDNETISHILNS